MSIKLNTEIIDLNDIEKLEESPAPSMVSYAPSSWNINFAVNVLRSFFTSLKLY